MKWEVAILNFDQTYQYQSFFKGIECLQLNLTSLNAVQSFCDSQTLGALTEELKTLRNTRHITFIGSGNYHYITYLLASQITDPFTLVVFDHHTDMMPSPWEGVISCGSWILHSIQNLPMLKKLVLVGVDDGLVKTMPLSNDKGKALSIITENLCMQHSAIAERMIRAIHTQKVYLSIDKDVLSKTDAVTNWDQGTMRLSQLLNCIAYLAGEKEICGVDVCGEYPIYYADSFKRENIEAIHLNDEANKRILTTMYESFSRVAATSH